MRSFAATLLLFCISPLLIAQTATMNPMSEKFRTPPDDARIMMRWWWFGPAVTKEGIEKELRLMREGGIGGVEVQPVYPLLPDDEKSGVRNLPYLSDEFLSMLRHTADKSRELGMRLDLTLGSGWSFGGATTPLSEAAGQIRFERVKIAPGARRVPVPSMIYAETLHGAFLAKTDGVAVVDGSLKPLSDIRDGNVFLPADAEGNEVLFFIGGKSGMQVKRPSVGSEGYVLNHLDKPSVDGYLRKTGDRLYSAFEKSNVPYSFFCDSLEVYQQDWTDDFLTEFEKRRAYDLKPHLPALAMDIGSQTADIRYDWGRTLTELFNERFMIPMQDWGRRNNTKFRIQGYGIPPAAISSNKWADISDGEGAQWKVVRAARWAASANHIYGRNVTSSETWTWLHSPAFRATPLDLKAEADIHFLQGINQVIGHGWAYTPDYADYPGYRFYAAGEYSNRNPWWIVMPELSKYLQRMSWLLRQGEPHNDVALYLPNADAYAKFSAAKVHLIDIERDLVGEHVMPALFESGFNLDFFDDAMLSGAKSGDGGEISIGASRHRAIVLPGIKRMPLESLKKIDEFVRNGGRVVATRTKPSLVPGLRKTESEQREFDAIAARLFGGESRNVRFVERDEDAGSALAALMTPDARISPDSREFGFVHRKTNDGDMYFVANTSNLKKNVEIDFRANGRSVEIWNAMDGSRNPAKVRSAANGATKVLLNFEPYQSHVVVFSDRSAAPVTEKPVTSATAIDLTAGWSVTFPGGKPEPTNLPHSWIDDEATKFFSGVAVYERSVKLSAEQKSASISLDFGEAQPEKAEVQRNGMRTFLDAPIKEAAVVYVNGQKAGALWCPPYRLEIGGFLKTGDNAIRIEVANTAVNHMAGRKLPDYRLLNLRYGERFQPQEMEKVLAYASGITGRVRLLLTK